LFNNKVFFVASRTNGGFLDVDIFIHDLSLNETSLILSYPYGSFNNLQVGWLAANSSQVSFYASQSSNSHYFRTYDFISKPSESNGNSTLNRVGLPFNIESNDKYTATVYKTTHPSALQRDISLSVFRNPISEFTGPILVTNAIPFGESYNTHFGNDIELANDILYATVSPTGSQSGPGSVVAINLLNRSSIEFERIYAPEVQQSYELNFASSLAFSDGFLFVGATGHNYASTGQTPLFNGAIYVYEYDQILNKHNYRFKIQGPIEFSGRMGSKISVEGNVLIASSLNGNIEYKLLDDYSGYELVGIHDENFIGFYNEKLVFFDIYSNQIVIKDSSPVS
jgi:hypothetical protein